ncbi:MAG: hypothetical protein Q8M31_08830 [Beijerinckiaceae bacterium]|nr:hypothetical protein [Beijerinckiaceae bacterium]
MNVSEAKQARVSVAQLATLTGVTETWIRRLIKEGWIPAPEDHLVPVVAGVQGYLRYLKDPSRRAQGSAEENRLLNAKAELLESRNRDREDRLIDIEEHRECGEFVLTALDEAFKGVPDRFTADPVVRERIRMEIAAVLARSRARFERLTAELMARGKARRH